MDALNRFHTKTTYMWMRLEHIFIVLAGSALVLANWRDINWWVFVLAFAYIDLIGYIPGAIVYNRKGGGPIPPIFHHLYNLMHSYLTAALVAAVWYFAAGGFQWEMLALPIHLSGDRGLFGNVFKPTSLSFEPVAAPDQAVSLAVSPGGAA